MSHMTPTDLFFSLRDRFWRVDLTRPGDDAITAAYRPDGSSVSDGMTALFAGVKRRSVLIFQGDAWCQTLDLASAQIDGLPDREKETALAFEAETFSGLSPAASSCAWSVTPARNGMVSCTILQVPTGEVQAIIACCRRCNLLFAGISHPLFLSDSDAAFTGDVTEETVRGWRDRFAQMKTVPRILPVSASSSAATGIYLSAFLLALLAVAICWWFDGKQRRELRRLTETDRTLAVLQQQQANKGKRLQAIENELKTAESEHAIRMEQVKNLQMARQAMAFLFSAITDHCPKEMMIRRLEPDGPFGLKVEGLCVKREAADTFLVTCGKTLAERGWRIQPEAMVARRQTKEGGPWLIVFRMIPPFAETDSRSEIQQGEGF